MDSRLPAVAAMLLSLGLASGTSYGSGREDPAQTRDEQDRSKSASSLQYDVVVTATRVETPAKEVASSISIVTAEEIARSKKTTVLEVLRDLVGLSTVQSGGAGAAASVLIRGANGEHTLVLLDGVELNDPINPTRSYDLAHLVLSQIERIEVLRGPQSPLYGSDALGGVINIITRKGQGAPKLTVSGSGGNYGSYAGEVALSGSSGRADYSLGVFYARTSGVSAASTRYAGNSEADGDRNFSLSGKFGYAVRQNWDFDITVRTVWDRTAIDDAGGAYGDDPNNMQNYASAFVSARLRHLALGGRWEQKMTLSWIAAERKYLNPTDDLHPYDSDSGKYGSDSLKWDWQNNLFINAANTLTAGAALEDERGHSYYVSDSQYGPYVSSFPSENAWTSSLYAQDQWKVLERLYITAGTRFDSHSRSGSALTYRVAPAYVIEGTGTKIKATLGTGFKSPSLYQLFAPATDFGPIGNIALKPERATGWDAGVEQGLFGRRVRLGLTYFHTSFRNLIDYDYSLGYINVGRAETKGLETSVEWEPTGALRLRTSYTRLKAVNEETDAELLRRPRDKFSADVHARFGKRLDTTLSLLYVGKRLDTDYGSTPYLNVTLPGYVLLSGVISTSVNPMLDLYARLDNILNARYEMVWGYGTLGFTINIGFRLAL
ncbi:MAG TPA: TonB-dependent receptor [Terriglobales bacterium]|nr:TonB-dependent receptor [Terriglobales bacterium]